MTLTGGIRNGGNDEVPVWHMLISLKALAKPAQVHLANTLSMELRQPTETSAAFTTRVKARWSVGVLTMLGEAEVQ